MGHSAGDFDVHCFYEDDPSLNPVRCCRVQLECNGIDTCECFDNNILKNCECFEPDPEAMQELWNHELDANTGEAENIIYRYKANLNYFGYLNLQPH